MYLKVLQYLLGRSSITGNKCCILRPPYKVSDLLQLSLECGLRRNVELQGRLYCTNNTGSDKKEHVSYLKYSKSLSSLRKTMDVGLLLPPTSVRGMTELSVEAFQKRVSVPHVLVNSNHINSALKYLKKYLLKMDNLKPVRCDENYPEKKVLLLNPLLVSKFEDVKEGLLNACDDQDVSFISKEITLNYENWKAEDILKAVLPDHVQGYSIIGHILHLNLKEHALPYKFLIGQVFLDKLKNVSLVVNKTNEIDSVYRNFQMEVLAGSGDTVVSVKENGCTFMMDFAKVYWNPRLSAEHDRILTKLKHGDILYDVMAGIGPFAVPAARKKCHVLANDLNPSSFDSLVKNCSLNKVQERVKCFNLDGQEFIKTVVKADLLEKWHDKDFCGDMHITMNLPALAVEFLPAFQGLYQHTDGLPENPKLPLVHVYMFTKEDKKDTPTSIDTAISMVAKNLGYGARLQETLSSKSEPAEESTISSTETVSESDALSCSESDNSQASSGGLREYIQEVVLVRRVAPNKLMMRVSVYLPLKIMLKNSDVDEEPPFKKVKAV